MEPIYIKLTKGQKEKLKPFENEVMRVYKAGSFSNDHRLAVTAQISFSTDLIGCYLLSKDQCNRIQDIAREKHIPITNEEIKNAVQPQNTLDACQNSEATGK